MATQSLKTIGVREFTEQLAEHVTSTNPLAITRHGMTIGYYIPAHSPTAETDRGVLEDATRRLHDMLEAQGIDPEELIRDYQTLRRAGKRSGG